MATHTIYFPDLRQNAQPQAPGSLVAIHGEEAHHAWRVKRLDVGHLVRLVDAKGAWSDATIARVHKHGREWALDLTLGPTHVSPETTPIVHVFAAAPKGDHLGEMIDQLSQVGAASWTPLLCERSVVEPREAKLERLHRITIEAMKQCGRTHALAINPAVGFAEFWRTAPRHAIVADASGASLLALPASATDPICLLVGPEGGLTPGEIEHARAHGAHVASLGVHTMRIETAAVVGAALLLARR
jgi:16S rRNA (uracil1498-N3)-methyltransferase